MRLQGYYDYNDNILRKNCEVRAGKSRFVVYWLQYKKPVQERAERNAVFLL